MTQSPPPPDPKKASPEGAKAPGMPATTSDYSRFPEHVESPELTSFVPAEDTIPFPPGQHPNLQADHPPGIPSFDPQIQLKRRLGAGGMGEVFLGLQKHLGREVAVKRIRDWGGDGGTKERFVHEAKAQSRLQHPGIAQVYDLRETPTGLFLIMEYVPGTTLQEVLAKEGKLSPERIVSIGAQLTEALEAAAHEGYIHRDLKPANVMLTEGGRVKIIDFGLALRFRSLLKTRFTEKGEIIGTPAYMSPEQLNEEEQLDVRSDIWALGVLLYTLATGEPPFTGRDFVCTVKNVMMSEPPALTELEKGFPPALWQAIAKALRKDRAERWQDYASFRAALLSGGKLGGAPVSAPVSKEQPGLAPGPVRHRSSRSAMVALLVVGASALAIALWAQLRPSGSKADGAYPNALDVGLSDRSKDKKTEAQKPSDLSPSPASAEIKKSADTTPAKDLAQRTSLREKLATYVLSEDEIAFVEDIQGVFAKHRPQLLAKDFASTRWELLKLENERLGLAVGTTPPPEKEYRASQLRAATRMVELAQGAMIAALSELKSSKKEVSILLRDGTTKTGVVRTIETGALSLAVPGGGEHRVPLESIVAESLRGQVAPATAYLALLALSGNGESAFGELLDLAESREEFLFWIPLALRLARLDVEAAAQSVALAKKNNPGILPDARPIAASWARVGVLSGKVKDRKEGILRYFNHLAGDLTLIEREETALRLLVGDAFSKVLALGPGTASFPVAAEILSGRFEAALEASHDELHARTGWHAYGWKLFPVESSLKEQAKYWDLDPEGNGSILKALDSERRVAMGTGAKRAPEGALARVVYEPNEGGGPASHWRILLRGREGSSTYLRIDASSCSLYRTRLDAGASDVQLAKAPLPVKASAKDGRAWVLMPLDGALHVFVDGCHVLGVPQADASIPMQMSFAVTQGKLWIQSVKVKKSSADE